MKHLAVFSDGKIQELLSGQLKYDFRFFKKKPEFVNKLSVGDIVYFRRRGEVLGQFEVGKIIIIERLEIRDRRLVQEITEETEGYLSKEEFDNKVETNSTLIIIQIIKLEQFITSPIEIDKRSKKEWVILD